MTATHYLAGAAEPAATADGIALGAGDHDAELGSRARRRWLAARRLVGALGVAAALPFFVWLALGWLDAIPSIVEVFGMTGLRVPAGITVGGLLLAAIGFHDD